MNYKCIDTNTEFCPCDLAENLNCISCSHLQGKDYCDCNWTGTCVFYEYVMNNMVAKQGRNLYKGLVVKKKTIGENLYLLKIETNRDLIKQLDTIGAYVFINKFYNKNHYDSPMSILDRDLDHIFIVYHKIGPKTKGIEQGDILGIKGPYFNGIIGRNKLSHIRDVRVLVAARSIGQSSIINAIRQLEKNNNKIYLFIDKGKCNSFYALDYLKTAEIDIRKINFFTKEGQEFLLNFLKKNKIDVIFSAGSDMLHREVSSIINKVGINTEWFVTNNNILCCGEGVCGSCIRKTFEGNRVKTCKILIDPRSFY